MGQISVEISQPTGSLLSGNQQTHYTEELTALHVALGTQAAIVSGKIREKVQSLLDTLQPPMNDIYKEIQGDNAKPIRLGYWWTAS